MNYSAALEAKARLIHSNWDPTQETRRLGRIPFVDDMTNILSDAGTYWISSDLLQTINAAAKSLPKDMEFSLDLLPSRSGFIWLDNRLKLDTTDPEYGHGILAVVWDDGVIDLSGYHEPGAERTLRPGVTISILGRRPLADSEDSRGDALGLSMSLSSWVYGDSLDRTYLDNLKYRDGAETPAHVPDTTIKATLDFFGAFCLFVRQRIATLETMRVERHARKRLDKAGWHGGDTVQVVQLRRREHAGRGRSENAEPVEWSCRWVVGGHWHNFWLGPRSQQVKQPRWLLPYVKGPDGKPLKDPGARVFAVVR